MRKRAAGRRRRRRRRRQDRTPRRRTLPPGPSSNAVPPLPTAPPTYKPAPRSIAAYYAGHAPALKRLRGAALLRELAARWRSHAMVSRNLQPLFKQPEARFTQPAITGVGTVAPPAAAVAASAAGAGAARESLEASRHRAFEKDCFRPSRAEFTAALAEVVNDAREGRAAIDRGVLRTAVDVFVQMGHVPGSAASLAVYKEGFESMLLEITASFYRVRSGLWLDADTVSAYLRRADAALKEESALCAECFHESTGAPLKLAVERELLERPFEAIVEKEGSGVKAMLRQERLEDLRLVYDLYHRSAVPACLGRLARVFEGHIVALGEGLIRDRAAPAAAAVGATGAGVGAGEAPVNVRGYDNLTVEKAAPSSVEPAELNLRTTLWAVAPYAATCATPRSPPRHGGGAARAAGQGLARAPAVPAWRARGLRGRD